MTTPKCCPHPVVVQQRHPQLSKCQLRPGSCCRQVTLAVPSSANVEASVVICPVLSIYEHFLSKEHHPTSLCPPMALAEKMPGVHSNGRPRVLVMAGGGCHGGCPTVVSSAGQQVCQAGVAEPTSVPVFFITVIQNSKI